MAVVFAVFSQSKVVTQVLGNAGSRAVAKVAALFLAGIAIMMIRSGITDMIARMGR
jgi:small neutral amino acid transporter SnatA (MarC family)